jgi:hypothetical protein
MADFEQPDIVDEFYIPFVRPLGNLVITFAKAEAALLELVTELKGGDESLALSVLKADKAKEQILALIRDSIFQGFDLKELVDGIESFWSDKERRNRYIHDEWYVGFYEEGNFLGTRGFPRKKNSSVVWGDPTPADVWNLALSFQQHDYLFSATAYGLRKRRNPADHDEWSDPESGANSDS